MMYFQNLSQSWEEDVDTRALQYIALKEKNTLSAQETLQMNILEDKLTSDLMQFFYQYPVLHRLIDSEDAGEFLDYCLPGLSGILDSYKHDWIPFTRYLKVIIKRRRNAWLRTRRRKQQEERCVLAYGDIPGITGIPAYRKYHDSEDEPELIDDKALDICDIITMQKEGNILEQLNATSPTKPLRKKRRTRLSAFTVDARYRRTERSVAPEKLFEEISRYPVAFHVTAGRKACLEDLRRINPPAYRLCGYLTCPLHRRRILMLMMTSPERFDAHDIEFMAALFDTDVSLLEELLWHARELQLKQQTNRPALKNNKNSHWTRMIMLQEEELLYTASEQDERMKAVISLEQQKKVAFHHRLHDLEHMQPRLSHNNIACMLKIPHGTVCSGIHYGKALIQHCLNQELDDEG